MLINSKTRTVAFYGRIFLVHLRMREEGDADCEF
jgi:hypothetical protein